MNIDLDSNEVYRILKKKGISFFFHANTVRTSLTYIESNTLLSRDFVERNGLKQTPQASDEKDKKFGIWNYIFLDARDLAEYFSRPNVYGPVLFILDNILLLDPAIPTVRITKFNPCYWTEKNKIDERYFTDLNDFEKKYLTGNKLADGGIMFIITTLNGRFELSKYLWGFRIDNSGVNIKNKDGSIVNLTDSIISTFKTRLKSKYKDKLVFKKRDYWFFRNLYRWKHKNKFESFKDLFYP